MTAPRASQTRIAIFGGSFDPPHLGHFIIAQDVLEYLGLDEIIFMPTARSPFKQDGPIASSMDRVRMLESVLDHRPGMRVDDYEIRQGGVSYTIDTARMLREQFPGAELSWIIGADQTANLPEWRSFDELARIVHFLVASRPSGENPDKPDLAGARLDPVPTRQIAISSTEVRRRLAEGRLVDFFLPASIHTYIKTHNLYAT